MVMRAEGRPTRREELTGNQRQPFGKQWKWGMSQRGTRGGRWEVGGGRWEVGRALDEPERRVLPDASRRVSRSSKFDRICPRHHPGRQCRVWGVGHNQRQRITACRVPTLTLLVCAACAMIGRRCDCDKASPSRPQGLKACQLSRLISCSLINITPTQQRVFSPPRHRGQCCLPIDCDIRRPLILAT